MPKQRKWHNGTELVAASDMAQALAYDEPHPVGRPQGGAKPKNMPRLACNAVQTLAASHRQQSKATRKLAIELRKLEQHIVKAEDRDIGSRTIRTMLLSEYPARPGTEWLQVIVERMMELAAEGNVRAFELLCERAYGRPGVSSEDAERVQKIALMVQQLAPLDARPAPKPKPEIVKQLTPEGGSTA